MWITILHYQNHSLECLPNHRPVIETTCHKLINFYGATFFVVPFFCFVQGFVLNRLTTNWKKLIWFFSFSFIRFQQQSKNSTPLKPTTNCRQMGNKYEQKYIWQRKHVWQLAFNNCRGSHPIRYINPSFSSTLLMTIVIKLQAMRRNHSKRRKKYKVQLKRNEWSEAEGGRGMAEVERMTKF